MKGRSFLVSLLCAVSLAGCVHKEQVSMNPNLARAQETLDSIYQCYSRPGANLLRENYPFDEQSNVTYLASEEQANLPNQYSYLWPYSGMFSAVNAMYEASGRKEYKELLDERVLPGLEEYFDIKREPYAYSSYIRTSAPSDRFYDDNVWLGIDFTDIYQMTQETAYLEKAQLIWKFILSGTDDQLGGGIYWCEQKKEAKHTCSNAPGAVLALKLFKATKDSIYYTQGKELYEWTKAHLQDSTDYLYFDNVRLDGKIGRAKYAYNSGQMMQSAALLYQLTGHAEYLADAQDLARECYNYFFMDFTPAAGDSFKLLKKGDIWFSAVMLRGFIELYQQDQNKMYLDAFNKSLKYAWDNARDDKGLFSVDLSGNDKDGKKWLLTQAAMVEMYGRLAGIKELIN